MQLLRLEGQLTGKELVEDHTERVDVGARVDVEAARLRLLRAHVGWRADQIPGLGLDRPLAQALLGGLGDAKVDHLGHRVPVAAHQDVRGLQVSMDHTFLVCMLDRLAHVDEELQAAADR